MDPPPLSVAWVGLTLEFGRTLGDVTRPVDDEANDRTRSTCMSGTENGN